MWYGEWRPYVPVAQRRLQAARYAAKLAKKEKRVLTPVKPEGRAIAQSFWGRAWCDNLESYSDFANRLPRGRTYIRNGSVIDLVIERGAVKAIVSGSDIYRVKIDIRTLAKPAWKSIKQDCSRSIASLMDLLRGRFDEGVMQRLTRPKDGLFPRPGEIDMQCSCPDWAGMCKHVAATLYGVGTRLDTAPELLFTLRNVDHLELIDQAVAAENLEATLTAGQKGALAESDLGELFGIELDSSGGAARKPRRRRRSVAVTSAGEASPRSRSAATSSKTTSARANGKSTRSTARSSAVATPKRKVTTASAGSKRRSR
jgi:uncharacterized Zn finger protein